MPDGQAPRKTLDTLELEMSPRLTGCLKVRSPFDRFRIWLDRRSKVLTETTIHPVSTERSLTASCVQPAPPLCVNNGETPTAQ
jgi:hypothetical protein